MANFLREEVKEEILFSSISIITKEILRSYSKVEILRERYGELVFKVEDFKFSIYFRLSSLDFSILDNLEKVELDITISKDYRVIKRDISTLIDLEDLIEEVLREF